MAHDVHPHASAAMSARRRALAPDIHDAFDEFSQRAFADGALPPVTKQLIAVAVAHVTSARTASAATRGWRTARVPATRR